MVLCSPGWPAALGLAHLLQHVFPAFHYFKCMGVFALVCLHHVYSWERPEEGVGSSGSRVTDLNKPLRGCREWNLSPPEGHPPFLEISCF